MKTGADLFCGAGGTTTGLLAAVAELNQRLDLLAINHWNIAIDSHTKNHPGVRHLCESLDSVDPRKVVPSGRLDILCASPECTHHSNARGGRPCSDQSRASAWHICRWAEALRIENILIENVREFRSWGPLTKKGRTWKRLKGKTFDAFLAALRSLGYTVEHRVLNAADYGDPTERHRLFIIARRSKAIRWPAPSHAGQWRGAREIIDWSIKGTPISQRSRPLSRNTMKRVEAGLEEFGGGAFLLSLRGTTPGHLAASPKSLDAPLPTVTAGGNHLALAEPFIIHTCHVGGKPVRSIDRPLPTITCAHRGELALVEPFIVKYFGKGKNHRSINAPLPTISTVERFALVHPDRASLEVLFRMLQPHEYSAAMSFPAGYQFSGTKGCQVKQIGNAVPVRTAAALCKSLLQ